MSRDLLITHFVGASAVVLVAAHAGGRLARWLGQPGIVGQLTAGIALGPSLLGSAAPGAYQAVFPEAIAPALTGLAQFSLVVFLSAVGYELDPGVLGERARTAVAVAPAAFAVPMAVCCACALLFGPWPLGLGMPERPSPAMVVFAGIALSITAVPVLTALVRENGLASTVPGVVAVSAAGLLDVIGWITLSAVTVPAVVTKVGSGTMAARLGDLDRHEARTVGVLLSARGLTELIALDAGLRSGLLSPCTRLTQPLLHLVRRAGARERPVPRPGPAAAGRPASRTRAD
ncbi:cation:proton antiporter [Streptomyces cadmiisoli]|uniref:Cation/H+ exchanger transmembrane domain-containing protein n=1 Tax=Streptomyces cadmiisoli TaxID=2184053 RepID=A0A2Z4IVH1_9ACTN|nr:cation:proton antiporter [Streptomyces cadmiisoli]AWW37101.1 hypothetical protein DN051_11045 [Streptomyces cadmiisoli]